MIPSISMTVPAIRARAPRRWFSEAATWMATIAFALVLTACGGGSNSGGGSTGNSFAGTYNGFATVTVSAPGLQPETETGTIQIVIDSQGGVTSDPGIPQSGTGQLNGNSFTATVPGSSFNQSGVTCEGAVLVRGTISGNTITGTISSNEFTCNGIPINFNGTYSAERAVAGGASRASVRGSVMETVQESLGTAW